MGCGHHHGATPPARGRKLFWTIVLNLLITIAQIVAGFWTHSLSLLSDALHNFSDVIALGISWFADRLSYRRSTPAQTFGYKRAEIVAAFVNAAMLIGIAVIIAKEAVERLWAPVAVDTEWVMIVAAISIVANGASAWLIHCEARNNLNMRSAYLHLFSDMMTSVAVLGGAVVMYHFGVFWVDSVLSILIAIYLVIGAFRLLAQTLKVIMQFSPDELDLDAVSHALKQIPEVKNIHHVHVWQLTDHAVHLEAHVDFVQDLPLSTVTAVIQRINTLLREKFHIHHTVIQPEINVGDSKALVVTECD